VFQVKHLVHDFSSLVKRPFAVTHIFTIHGLQWAGSRVSHTRCVSAQSRRVSETRFNLIIHTALRGWSARYLIAMALPLKLHGRSAVSVVHRY